VILMEWLFAALLLVLAVLVNIRSFFGLSEIKQQRQQMLEESEAISQSMEEFVEKLEKENDELYHKLVNYIKVKDSGLDEKIRALEEKLGTSSVENAPVLKPKVEEDEKVAEPFSGSSDQAKISQLYKQGFSASQIAKVLQMDRGKVELAINIYSKKKSYQN
jgi:predicted nuclease with TOPRIM domain